MRAMRCARDCEDGFVSYGLRKDAFQFFYGKEGPFRVTWPTTLEEFQEENRQLGEWYNLTSKLNVGPGVLRLKPMEAMAEAAGRDEFCNPLRHPEESG